MPYAILVLHIYSDKLHVSRVSITEGPYHTNDCHMTSLWESLTKQTHIASGSWVEDDLISRILYQFKGQRSGVDGPLDIYGGIHGWHEECILRLLVREDMDGQALID